VTGKTALRIAFADFADGLDPENNWFTRVLRTRFDVHVVDDPDILVHSVYGTAHRSFPGTRVLFNWENRPWGFSTTDWAFTSDYHRSERHRRLPFWVTELQRSSTRPTVDGQAVRSRTRFCGAVISSDAAPLRTELLDAIGRVGEISHGGRMRNNVGGPVADKQAFLETCRFAIALENSSHPGYTTEKVLHALQANTIPIYWGDPLVGRDFNTARMVSFHDFEGVSAFLDRIGEIESDPTEFERVVTAPWFADDHLPQCADLDRFLNQFERIRVWDGVRAGQRRAPRSWWMGARDHLAASRRIRSAVR
jgi:hypothetical protein